MSLTEGKADSMAEGIGGFRDFMNNHYGSMLC